MAFGGSAVDGDDHAAAVAAARTAGREGEEERDRRE